jgi:hypothetical protein
LTAKRFFLPWRPIPVAPIGARLLSERGIAVVLRELVAFSPAWILAAWPRRGGARPGASFGAAARGIVAGLLAFGCISWFAPSLPALALGVPAAIVSGAGAAILLRTVRRFRWLAAPAIGVSATALGFAMAFGIQAVARFQLFLEDRDKLVAVGGSWRDVPEGVFGGLLGFVDGIAVYGPLGVLVGYLLAHLVGSRPAGDGPGVRA